MKKNILIFPKEFFAKPIVKDLVVTIFIAALVSSSLSYFFTKKINQATADRDFIFNFDRTFYDNAKYRKVSIAIEESYLDGGKKIFKANGGHFSDYEVEDYLFLLYDLYAYGEESLVKYKMIDDQFHYYVCLAHQNKEIRDYRKELIAQGFSKTAAFGFLDDLATKLGIHDSSDCKNL